MFLNSCKLLICDISFNNICDRTSYDRLLIFIKKLYTLLCRICALIKLVGLVAIGAPLAIYFGFITEKLVAILVMLGSATTVSSYIMAKNMDHDGTLSASVIMLTTLLSAVTLTGWLYLFKSMGYV